MTVSRLVLGGSLNNNMPHYTIEEIRGYLAHGVSIIDIATHNKWLVLTLSGEFGTATTRIRFKKW